MPNGGAGSFKEREGRGGEPVREDSLDRAFGGETTASGPRGCILSYEAQFP